MSVSPRSDVEILVTDDEMTSEERAELHGSLDRALEDSDAGRAMEAYEYLRRYRATREDRSGRCLRLMSPFLADLLKLPARERAALAMALWESLSETQREDAQELSAEQAAELDRRWAEHGARPDSAIPWDDVGRRLVDRE